MKKFLLLICFLLSSYAGASFDGHYFCGGSNFFSIEMNNNETANIEILTAKGRIAVDDAIVFNYEEDSSFEVKMYMGSQLVILNFSNDSDILRVESSYGNGDVESCNKLISLEV
ncbi:hypothetical protein [Halobacteriovorax marinus]|uniref:hypothetical protein n=1 Tax=Halobacteriovorax marinus TaxID=97084 RepID=UPI003A90D953